MYLDEAKLLAEKLISENNLNDYKFQFDHSKEGLVMEIS